MGCACCEDSAIRWNVLPNMAMSKFANKNVPMMEKSPKTALASSFWLSRKFRSKLPNIVRYSESAEKPGVEKRYSGPGWRRCTTEQGY